MSSSEEGEETAMPPSKVAHMRVCLDILTNFFYHTTNLEIQSYEHLCTLCELVIHEQYQWGKQLKLDTFFKRRSLQRCISTKPQPSTSTAPALPLHYASSTDSD